MFSIRRNIFETNSSSTHAIAIDGVKSGLTKEDLLKDNGHYTPYDSEKHMRPAHDLNVYFSLEDKLMWLLTSIRQGYFGTPDSEDQNRKRIKELLIKIMPNATFDFFDTKDCYYEFEDIEYMWDDYLDEGCEGAPLFCEDTLVDFLCNGVVIWGSRDVYNNRTFVSFVDSEINKHSNIIVKFTG